MEQVCNTEVEKIVFMEGSALIPSPFQIWTAQCLVSGTNTISAPLPKVYLGREGGKTANDLPEIN